ncbi:S8 family serine peptidase [Solwaraspora sp. WMMD1047]|uniref:S8 family serine peptidase n=1 Tax=Solwaraspora sp. WMMD1047 TaxID=3016102 RepID=UPI002415CD81|nr:S8 family serine peptidase [Solwaraspora sp. WMMD1047]MDG4829688.1 S8 family serine peptidase [Solwaraspora sp. WMMD1047]
MIAIGLPIAGEPTRVAAATTNAAGATSAVAAGAPAGHDAAGTRTVTLLTGDRVSVNSAGVPAVRPAAGRADVRFVTRRLGERLQVLPADALPALRAGQLDERLFDVTALLDFGYDRRPDLPILVTYSETDARTMARENVTAAGARITRDLPAVDGFAATVTATDLTGFWTALTTPDPAGRTLGTGLETVWLDGLRRPALADSVPAVGAPAAWAAGLDGTGVTVAVLDSGIDADHPDLAGRVAGRRNFTEGAEDDRDRTGHGTHVASTVAGTGAGGSPGVAPGAELLDGKVCVDGGCAESWILAGMQWAAEQGAAVVNLSLGGPDTPEADPVEQAVQSLTAAHGTLFVAAAGNIPGPGTIGSPASADAALAVGAVTKNGELATFSSRGPRATDGAIKPDLTAPGVDIVAARGADSGLGEPGQVTTALSGTSMAAPHVAGAAALLAQRHPDWSAGRLKSTLMAAARPDPRLDVFAQGAGGLDVARAIAQSVVAEPASLSFGRQLWPHGDDAPTTRKVVYRNHGDAAVTVDLSVRAAGPDGAAVPAAMFTVEPATVTLPAGAAVEVTVTADTRVDGPEGQLTGQVVAVPTAGGGAGADDPAVVTPLAIDREVESYDVTVRHLGRDGAATAGYVSLLASWDGELGRSLAASDDGTVTTRLPKGRYAVLSSITSPEGDGYTNTMLAQPELTVTADRSVVLDSRIGEPVSVGIGRTDAEQVFAEVASTVSAQGRTVEVGALGRTFDAAYLGRVGPDVAAPGFVSRVSATFTPTEAADRSFAYLLCWLTEDRMGTGFTRQVSPAELATVRANHAQETSGSTGQKLSWAVLPESVLGGFAHPVPVALPSERTEYYNVDGRARWFRSFDEITGTGDQRKYLTSSVAPPAAYRAGQAYQEQWSRGVFGPTVAAPPYEHQWVTRRGDTLSVLAPLFGDGLGRAGYSSIATGRITVFRDGEPFAELDGLHGELTVPPQEADYRLEMVAERAGPATLSTRVEVAWTFRSGHRAGDEPVRLPLSTVRFSPAVDSNNTTPAGTTASVPIAVTAQPDSPAGGNDELRVEVSYDDGANWTVATVVDGRVQLRHPDSPGYVSLRAAATDTAGNTVRQTVLRAYRIE